MPIPPELLSPERLWPSLAGGLLIGASAALLLLGAGRVAGISGILQSVVSGPRSAPRTAFLAGLLLTAAIAAASGAFDAAALLTQPHWSKLLPAGLLVGIGTQLGQGCTSGHGVCGIANGSARGLAATLTFMTVAALVVAFGWGGLA